MPARCPYLRLAEDRNRALIEASTRHRCYARYQAERVGLVYQTDTCLTDGYRLCPRQIGLGSHGWEPVAQISSSHQVAPAGPARRRMTLTEMSVLAMGIAIVLAGLFVGYAVVHRVVTGPTVVAALPMAQEVMPAPIEELAMESPTPMTSTPTPLPTLADNVVAPAAPATPAPAPALPSTTPYVRVPADSPPTRLVIPKIGLDIPVWPVGVKTVRDSGKTKVVWADLPNAGAFHETSAYPGNVGNTVINGHRDIKGAVFRRLNRLEVGDEIVLYVGDLLYPYVVAETLVVPEAFASAEQRAENQRLIGYMPEERLTLITCTPVGLATHRLLVIAKPLEQGVPDMPGAGGESGP